MPSIPAANDSFRFIPKPNPTTEICKRYFEKVFTFDLNKHPNRRANKIPEKRPTAGERNKEIHLRKVCFMPFSLSPTFWSTLSGTIFKSSS